jgi:sulfatase modifying factor 1
MSMVHIERGVFSMGTEDSQAYPDDGEGPVHEVEVPSFWIDPRPVANERFGAFVAATGYRTTADRSGWSFVFGGLLPDDFPATRGVASAPWWRQVFGASWHHPEGPQSSIDERLDHPVVHVSWDDAMAFCEWAGCRLLTEAEWEYAARGGLRQRRFPWGDELEPAGEHHMNVWQGVFPSRNSAADGFVGTAPAGSFPPNGYGLFDMTGNVWEWCADWFNPGYYAHSPREAPTGPEDGTHRVMRGGSYLCHESHCRRYRVAARSANTPDSSTGNLGFRCARDG